MFMSGMSPYTAFAFSIMTMGIGVPSAIKTFNWLGTIWRGRIRFHSPMLFAVGFVSLFVTGGISGPFFGATCPGHLFARNIFRNRALPSDYGRGFDLWNFRRYLLLVPKMFGKMMNETLAKLHFWLTFVGAYAIFMPMHYSGMAGQLRRYSQGTEVAWIKALTPIQVFISIAAFITIGSQFIFLFNLFWSMWKGKKASDNPWEATTLEWITATPPPHDNFGGRTPVVHNGTL